MRSSALQKVTVLDFDARMWGQSQSLAFAADLLAPGVVRQPCRFESLKAHGLAFCVLAGCGQPSSRCFWRFEAE